MERFWWKPVCPTACPEEYVEGNKADCRNDASGPSSIILEMSGTVEKSSDSQKVKSDLGPGQETLVFKGQGTLGISVTFMLHLLLFPHFFYLFTFPVSLQNVQKTPGLKRTSYFEENSKKAEKLNLKYLENLKKN